MGARGREKGGSSRCSSQTFELDLACYHFLVWTLRDAYLGGEPRSRLKGAVQGRRPLAPAECRYSAFFCWRWNTHGWYMLIVSEWRREGAFTFEDDRFLLDRLSDCANI